MNPEPNSKDAKFGTYNHVKFIQNNETQYGLITSVLFDPELHEYVYIICVNNVRSKYVNENEICLKIPFYNG